ncbi:MAG TPA: phosphopantetheine-binding protein [Pseudonocardiaceae bacterium]|jgi:hypothetical protein|nr:phosphopantetheine-binding protein [Pseudonocardiaceae bacterium]
MADMDHVDDIVLSTLSEVLTEPVEDLLAQPVLAGHEWDSQLQLEALAQLEHRLGITLDLRTYHGARTVGDLIEIVATAVKATTAVGH